MRKFRIRINNGGDYALLGKMDGCHYYGRLEDWKPNSSVSFPFPVFTACQVSSKFSYVTFERREDAEDEMKKFSSEYGGITAAVEEFDEETAS